MQNVNFGIQNGCNLSRARILRFRHNDVADLQRVLEGVAAEDRQSKCARLQGFGPYCGFLGVRVFGGLDFKETYTCSSCWRAPPLTCVLIS